LGAFLAGCMALYDIVSARIHLFTRKFSSGQITIIIVLFVVIVGGSIVVGTYWDRINIILQATVFQKDQSDSFQERAFADLLAMRIFIETYGLGLGLGSHKANSIVTTLLSNTGIAGLVLFAAFMFMLVRPVRAGSYGSQTEQVRRLLSPFQMAVLGFVLMHI